MMTVGKLIGLLQGKNPKMGVYVYDDGIFHEIREIKDEMTIGIKSREAWKSVGIFMNKEQVNGQEKDEQADCT